MSFIHPLPRLDFYFIFSPSFCVGNNFELTTGETKIKILNLTNDIQEIGKWKIERLPKKFVN